MMEIRALQTCRCRSFPLLVVLAPGPVHAQVQSTGSGDYHDQSYSQPLLAADHGGPWIVDVCDPDRNL